MEDSAIGRQLRTRRTAAGRTVASVAADAGLSVPYIANLENGRGNPTTAALARLAEALGLRLIVTLVPDEASESVGAPAVAPIPASLVRLGRTSRFRRSVTAMAAALGRDADEFSAQLVAALAALGQAMGRDLAEADWWRLLDALLLIAAHPSASLGNVAQRTGGLMCPTDIASHSRRCPSLGCVGHRPHRAGSVGHKPQTSLAAGRCVSCGRKPQVVLRVA